MAARRQVTTTLRGQYPLPERTQKLTYTRDHIGVSPPMRSLPSRRCPLATVHNRRRAYGGMNVDTAIAQPIQLVGHGPDDRCAGGSMLRHICCFRSAAPFGSLYGVWQACESFT